LRNFHHSSLSCAKKPIGIRSGARPVAASLRRVVQVRQVLCRTCRSMTEIPF
jgi:hypothetical protein